MKWRFFWGLMKYALAFGLLGYMIWKNWDNIEQVWEGHRTGVRPIHYGFFSLAVIITIPSVLLTFVRWYVLVRAVEIPFTLFNAVRLGMVGFFFNIFLPGAVGGDIIKAAFLARDHHRRTVAVSTVIMDRAIALWALVWFVAVLGTVFWASGMLGQEDIARLVVKTAIGVVLVTGLIWVLLGLLSNRTAERLARRMAHVRGIGQSLAEFWRAVWMYRCRQRAVALAMLISWAGHVGFVLLFYCCACTLAEPGLPRVPDLADHFLLVPIGLVIEAIPLFPGGVGIGEVAFSQLYKAFGGAAKNGFFGAFIKRVIYWILGFLAYLVYLQMKPSLPTKLAEEDEAEMESLNGEAELQMASTSRSPASENELGIKAP